MADFIGVTGSYGNIKATEFLLKIILKRDEITVINVVGQREIQSPVVGRRNIRLDGRRIMYEAVEKYAKKYAERRSFFLFRRR